jgi:hypothetical protein
MSSEEDRSRRNKRLKVKNSHHASHKHDGAPKKKLEPHHRHGRIDNVLHEIVGTEKAAVNGRLSLDLQIDTE